MLIYSFPVKAVLFQGYSDLPTRALPFLCAYLWESQITEDSCTECRAQEGSWKIIFMSVGLKLHVQCIILTVGREVLLVTKAPQPVQSRHPIARLCLSRHGFLKKKKQFSFFLFGCAVSVLLCGFFSGDGEQRLRFITLYGLLFAEMSLVVEHRL